MNKTNTRIAAAVRNRAALKLPNTAVTITHQDRPTGAETTATVTLHGNPVANVVFDASDKPVTLKLDACGWHTPTTRDRMNAAMAGAGLQPATFLSHGELTVATEIKGNLITIRIPLGGITITKTNAGNWSLLL